MEWLFAQGGATRWACWLKRMSRHLVRTAVVAVAVAQVWPVPEEVSAGLVRSIRFVYGWSVLLGLAVYLDRAAERRRLRRKTLRGTREVSPEEFNRKIRGDGLGIPYLTVTGRGVLASLRGEQVEKRYLRIAAIDEARHVLVCGDTGYGKSALMHDFLCQIAERPGTGVVGRHPLEFWEGLPVPGGATFSSYRPLPTALMEARPRK